MAPEFSERKSIRLPGYVYSQDGWYFVTLCTQNRRKIFGKIVNGNVYLSPLGHVANWELAKLRVHFPQIILDQYIIMPNHVHVIMRIMNGRENRAPTLGQIIAYFKYQTTKQYNDSVGAGFSSPNNRYIKLWQRNYYEHIVRDERDLNRIREYIQDNPKNWHRDKLRSP